MPLHPRLAAKGSMTNSRPPDPEIRLSVSDSGDVEPTAGPPKERRPLQAILFGSRRRSAIILSTAFIAVLAVAIGWYTYDRSEKEAPVEPWSRSCRRFMIKTLTRSTAIWPGP